MKEIKFRQPKWNKGKFGGFHYWGFVNEGEFTGVIPPIEKAQKESQQFTGLHDKTGKEIYEGDIVEYETTNFIGEVRFHTSPKTEFYLFGTDINKDLYPVSDIKVIGNIYENPKLLEAK